MIRCHIKISIPGELVEPLFKPPGFIKLFLPIPFEANSVDKNQFSQPVQYVGFNQVLDLAFGLFLNPLIDCSAGFFRFVQI